MAECFFYIRDGEIQNKKVVRQAFEGLRNGKYSLKIEPKSKRSLPQNAYFHGVVLPIVFNGLRDAGFENVKDVHDTKAILKALFLKEKIVNTQTGEIIEIIRDTHTLSTLEMLEFQDQIVRWAAEYLSVTIPLPGTQTSIL